MKTWVYRLLTCVVMTAVGLGFVVCAASREVVLTVGFVSDSYWDAPLGNCYAVLDAAIDRFENKHPGVRVTYTSGILKEDYSEWLAGQYLLGKEPDVFMVLPEDFDRISEHWSRWTHASSAIRPYRRRIFTVRLWTAARWETPSMPCPMNACRR